MNRILFPTDFSETANNAFLYALNLAKQYDADIDVVHATSKLKVDIEGEFQQKFDEYLHYLENVKNQFNENFEIEINGYIETGDLVIVSQEMTYKNPYLYIVMGTEGESSFNDKLLGTNTMNVINNSEVPVLAIPNHVKFKKDKRLGFASRLLENEYFTLKKLVVLAKRNGFPLEVVHIAKNEALEVDLEITKSNWEKEFDDEDLDLTILYRNEIEQGIADFIDEKQIDVLCVIHRNLNTFERLFRTNFSKKFLQTLHIPILVFPESK